MDNELSGNPGQEANILSQEQMLEELSAYCNKFIERSSEWRLNSFENQWDRWQRNADSIYDPEVASKKEPWQSKAFWPITASHRENAQSQLFKTEVGPRPPLEIKARGAVNGQVDQSENIRDLILREREKSRYEVERNKVLEDKTTFGSGFARMRFEEVIEERKVKTPVYEKPSVYDPGSIMRAMSGQPAVTGYQDELKPQIIYRGTRFEHVSIWDVFPDPLALAIKGSTIAVRFKMTYGDIVKGSQPQADGSPAYYLPQAAEKLKGVPSEELQPRDKRVVDSARNISDSALERPDYGALHTCYELYGRLPKKWVLINGEMIDDPEKLVPARIIFHKLTPIAVEFSDAYDGEPPIYKDDYMPVAGQFYGRGIPEMLKDVQSVCNEEINQRLDSKSITLNPMFAVIERAVVDPNDFVSKTGGVIRIKAKDGMTDIRQALQRIDMGSIDRAAFIEPQEWERAAQERTSVNRVTLGTDQTKDVNRTLGGQNLLKASAGDKFAYIGMMSEFSFQYEINRAFWKLIYSHLTQDDIVMSLGPERAATFTPMTPEQVENGYQYIPMGIFTMENKAERQARLSQWDQQFGQMPWANRLQLAKSELQSMDEDPEVFILPEADALQINMKAQQMATQMLQQHLQSQSQEKPKEAPNDH